MMDELKKVNAELQEEAAKIETHSDCSVCDDAHQVEQEVGIYDPDSHTTEWEGTGMMMPCPECSPYEATNDREDE